MRNILLPVPRRSPAGILPGTTIELESMEEERLLSCDTCVTGVVIAMPKEPRTKPEDHNLDSDDGQLVLGCIERDWRGPV